MLVIASASQIINCLVQKYSELTNGCFPIFCDINACHLHICEI